MHRALLLCSRVCWGFGEKGFAGALADGEILREIGKPLATTFYKLDRQSPLSPCCANAELKKEKKGKDCFLVYLRLRKTNAAAATTTMMTAAAAIM